MRRIHVQASVSAGLAVSRFLFRVFHRLQSLRELSSSLDEQPTQSPIDRSLRLERAATLYHRDRDSVYGVSFGASQPWAYGIAQSQLNRLGK
jgi:hypothetical protein